MALFRGVGSGVVGVQSLIWRRTNDDKSKVADFLAQRTLAVVDVSRDLKAFANGAYRELKEKGYRLLPVNPHMEAFDGE